MRETKTSGTDEKDPAGHCCQGKGQGGHGHKGEGGHCGRHGHDAPADDKAGHAHGAGHRCCRDRD